MQKLDPCTTVPENLPMLLDSEQAAALANCSAKHIRELLRDGRLQGAKVGNLWRVNRDALLQMLGLIGA